MGLDKKPSPPKREMEEDCEGKQVGSWKDGVRSEPSGSSTDQKSSKESVLVILPSHEADVETVEDKMETGQDYQREEGTKLPNCEAEDSQEDTGKNGTVFQNTSVRWNLGEADSGESIALWAPSFTWRAYLTCEECAGGGSVGNNCIWVIN